MEEKLSQTTYPDDHFGLCPKCGRENGYINIGRGHWFKCDAHQVIWFVGENLFSSWRSQSEVEQRRIFKEHQHYERVSPVFGIEAKSIFDAANATEVIKGDSSR